MPRQTNQRIYTVSSATQPICCLYDVPSHSYKLPPFELCCCMCGAVQCWQTSRQLPILPTTCKNSFTISAEGTYIQDCSLYNLINFVHNSYSFMFKYKFTEWPCYDCDISYIKLPEDLKNQAILVPSKGEFACEHLLKIIQNVKGKCI